MDGSLDVNAAGKQQLPTNDHLYHLIIYYWIRVTVGLYMDENNSSPISENYQCDNNIVSLRYLNALSITDTYISDTSM